ncbi:hypothetical protein EG68_12363 [Paragonimus skrjabini miyazakii]|uniref:Uncharacterized protein n=1 Tax=Paragonimus skrjabini miyazakii TaxID=59628 RepID=A0A8S9YHI5_9TREM|nr:hypothetical protein EG68_12363 [Paragonimus skrjabini miyazakii]
MDVCALELEDDLLQSAFVGDSARFSRFPLDSETVNYQDSQKRSVLHAAAYSGNTEITALLLQHGARVNHKDLHWLTALHRACASNAEGVVKVGKQIFLCCIKFCSTVSR